MILLGGLGDMAKSVIFGVFLTPKMRKFNVF
jgi:hypothetical protein